MQLGGFFIDYRFNSKKKILLGGNSPQRNELKEFSQGA